MVWVWGNGVGDSRVHEKSELLLGCQGPAYVAAKGTIHIRGFPRVEWYVSSKESKVILDPLHVTASKENCIGNRVVHGKACVRFGENISERGMKSS